MCYGITNRGENMAFNIEYLDTIDSTNNYLKKLAEDGAPSGKTVVANCQTAGRGRRGREFMSIPDKGIYLSYLLRINDVSPKNCANLTAWVSVAVRNAIISAYGIDTQIKWVNDIVLNRKKVGGILTEISVDYSTGNVSYIIIGIGLNVNHSVSDFPEELQGIASSFYAETGVMYDRTLLCEELIRALDRLSLDFPSAIESYLVPYRENCITLGNKIRIITPVDEKMGFALSIDDSFGLYVKLDSGEHTTIYSGDVSVRGYYGYV